MLILSCSFKRNQVLIKKSSDLALRMSGRFLILLGTFFTSQNHVLVQTLLFAENKKQKK